MLGIRREARALLKGLRRGVVMHQIGVKQAKEGRVIPKAVLRQCLSEAKKRIPEVLDQLENDLQQKTQFSFYGYLTAYYASIYGHRLGVFQNLTIREVEGAVKSPSTGDYLINISLHKTNRAFGPAQMSLTAEEYGWFRRFLALRDQLVGGPDACLFFSHRHPTPVRISTTTFRGLGCRWACRGSQLSWTCGPPSSPTRKDESPTSSPPTSESSTEEEGEAVPYQESGVSSLDSPPSLEKYQGENMASSDSSSSSSIRASPVRTPSDLSAPSGEMASPAVHDPEQADPEQADPEQAVPEQADPEQAVPEQAAPALGLLSRPKRVVRKPVVVLTPVKPALSPLSRSKICRVSGV
ncbi:uncharacterized protein [Misgurnus anguillicaudatus]|uniref:uncharacterized protein n=1 Tax=Misgurnus anguillicaudatus TaxID=75329 RepID=UPI003CCFB51A